jgi:predicted nucleotidyltransferase
VFGSVARGDDRAHSDIDLLVDNDPGRSLLDIVGLGQDLEELLDPRVDVLTDAVCTQALRDRILAGSRPL